MPRHAWLMHRGRNAGHVSEIEPLDSVFKLFMTSSNHMLLAHSEDGTVTGLITLEDVMEELIQVGASSHTYMQLLPQHLSCCWPSSHAGQRLAGDMQKPCWGVQHWLQQPWAACAGRLCHAAHVFHSS